VWRSRKRAEVDGAVRSRNAAARVCREVRASGLGLLRQVTPEAELGGETRCDEHTARYLLLHPTQYNLRMHRVLL